MLSIETLFYDELVGAEGVAEILAERVYPVTIPQATISKADTYPCLVYRRTATERGKTLRGNDGTAVATIRVECLDVTYAGVKELANEVRLAILTLSGTVDEQIVQGIHLDNEFDSFYNDVVVEGKAGVFVVELQYAVTYLEQSA